MTTENQEKDPDLRKQETTASEQLEADQAQDDSEFSKAFDELGAADADPADEAVDTKDGEPAQGKADDEAPAKAALEPALEPAKAEEVDPFAGLNEAAMKAVEELKTKAALAEHQASSSNGRVSALTKKIDELSRALPKATAPTAAQIRDAFKTPENWGKFQEQFPDVAAPMEERIKSEREQLLQHVDQRIEARVKPHDEALQLDAQERVSAYEQSQIAELSKAHPDYKQTVKTNEFKQWIATQPPIIQNGVGSPQAADAIHVINLFKSATSKVADLNQRRQQRLHQAAAIPAPTRAASNGRQAEVPDDFNAAWDHFDRQTARR